MFSPCFSPLSPALSPHVLRHDAPAHPRRSCGAVSRRRRARRRGERGGGAWSDSDMPLLMVINGDLMVVNMGISMVIYMGISMVNGH